MTDKAEPLPDAIDLVRDILDEQVVGRDERAVGKVDSILFELREGSAPRVAALEVGGVAAARRLSPAAGRWFVSLMRRLGVGPVEPLRVGIGELVKCGVNLQLDVDADETPAYAWERWLRKKVIGRIPGSG